MYNFNMIFKCLMSKWSYAENFSVTKFSDPGLILDEDSSDVDCVIQIANPVTYIWAFDPLSSSNNSKISNRLDSR